MDYPPDDELDDLLAMQAEMEAPGPVPSGPGPEDLMPEDMFPEAFDEPPDPGMGAAPSKPLKRSRDPLGPAMNAPPQKRARMQLDEEDEKLHVLPEPPPAPGADSRKRRAAKPLRQPPPKRARRGPRFVHGAPADYLFVSPVMGQEFTHITGRGGQSRIYLRTNTEDEWKERELEQSAMIGSRKAPGVEAAEKSIAEMMQEIDDEAIALAAQESENPGVLPDTELDRPHENLWVDKYAPSKYGQLLSSEETNRSALSWVKAWDPIVFGVERKKKKARENAPKRTAYLTSMPAVGKAGKHFGNISHGYKGNDKSKGKWDKDKGGFGNKFGKTDEPKKKFWKRKGQEDDDDPLACKLVLLAGAPGTGKTTLAHMLARHCGYRVIEVNASDDRNAKRLTEKIENAATVQPVFGDRRPPLIVLDEIDGACDKKAIKAVINLVLGQGKHRGKKGTKRKPLNRPVICCCNDLYAPALRPLREIAKVFRFKCADTGSLVRRLQYICRQEYIQADHRALSYLADITDKDIRSCLNTLQFIKSKSNCGSRLSTRVTHGMLMSMPIGRKDFTRGLFDVWDAILKKSRPKDRKDTEHCTGQKRTEWQRLYRLICDAKSDKLLDGVQENYLELEYRDVDGSATLAAAEWLQMGDVWRTQMRKRQWFFLFGYVPFVSIVIHSFCATDAAFRTQYPRQEWQMRQKKKENEAIVQDLLSPKQGSGKGVVNWTPTSAILDILPFLLHIVGTTVDPKPRDQMNRKDKRAFSRALSMMIDCNINFKPVREEFGDVEMSPPINQVVQFSEPEKHKPSSRRHADQNFASLDQHYMQFVAHELKMEKIRRVDAVQKFAEQQARYDKKEFKRHQEQLGEAAGAISPLRKKLQELSPKTGQTPLAKKKKKSASRTPKGGGIFGRDRIVPSQSQSQSARNGSPSGTSHAKGNFMALAERKIVTKQTDLQLKYICGYTNAVKRKTKTRDWL